MTRGDFSEVALPHPDLTAEQLEDDPRTCGLRGAGLGSSVNGLPPWPKTSVDHVSGLPGLSDAGRVATLAATEAARPGIK